MQNLALQEEGGCVEKGQPCPIFLTKLRWVEAGFPISNDKVVKEKLERLLVGYKKEMKSIKMYTTKPEKKIALVAKWAAETINIAKEDWQKIVNADRLISRSKHKEKIAVLSDYIVSPASR